MRNSYLNTRAPYTDLHEYIDTVQSIESTEQSPASVFDLDCLFDAMYKTKRLLERLTKGRVIPIDEFRNFQPDSDSINAIVVQAKEAISQFSILDFDKKLEKELEAALVQLQVLQDSKDADLDDLVLDHLFYVVEKYVSDMPEYVTFLNSPSCNNQTNINLLLKLGGEALQKMRATT